MASIRIKRGIASKSNPVGKHGNPMCSGFQIFWGIVTASKGIATLKDIKVINAAAKKVFGYGNENAHRDMWNQSVIKVLPVRNKSKMSALFEALKKSGKLSKSYECIIITDKQFGKGGKPTTKQRAEMVTI